MIINNAIGSRLGRSLVLPAIAVNATRTSNVLIDSGVTERGSTYLFFSFRARGRNLPLCRNPTSSP